MKEFIIYLVKWVDPLFLWYFGAINAVYTILLFFGMVTIQRRKKEISVENFTTIFTSNSLPQITFILTIHNNGKDGILVAENLLNLSYRYKHVIVVNDGSSDDSLGVFIQELEMVKIPLFYEETLKTKPIRGVYQSKKNPEVVLIDKENGGKFDANNAGINATTDPFFILIDADTYVDDQEFEALIRPILSDPEIIGVGTSVRIRNDCTLNFNRISTVKFPQSSLAAYQCIEYLRAFLQRLGWDFVGGNVVISGAFSVYKTKVIRDIGGYMGSVAEDMEIVIRLHRLMEKEKIPYRMMHLPDPVAWTEGPSNNKTLGKQRSTWHMGLMEALWLHKDLILNPKYGVFGLFNIPFWIWGEMIEPLVEVLGYIMIIGGFCLGILNPPFVLLFLLVAWGFTVLFTIFSILIEDFSFKKYPSLRTIALLFFYAIVENFGYRQKNIYWRVRGIVWFFLEFSYVKKIALQVKILLKKVKISKEALS